MSTKSLSGCTRISSRGATWRSRFRPDRARWVVALTLGLWAGAVQAKELRYRYVSLDTVVVPSGFAFFLPTAINDSGRVYGFVCDDGASCSQPRIAFYQDGAVTVLPEGGTANVVNDRGVVGGSVLVDAVNFVFKAAIFSDGVVDVIQAQPGDQFGTVIALNNHGAALVESDGARSTYWLRSDGQTTRLDFGPTITNPIFLSGHVLNDHGIIAGIEGNPANGARGFRLDLCTGQSTLLEPVLNDTLAWGLCINDHGDVLGYSFGSPGTYHERIGVWDRNGQFTTYIDETIVSNRLLFNDKNLIVITQVRGGSSYVVPRPGVRLNLTDVVDGLPAGQDLSFIEDLNNHGDMIGFSSAGGTFLLMRSEGDDHDDR